MGRLRSAAEPTPRACQRVQEGALLLNDQKGVAQGPLLAKDRRCQRELYHLLLATQFPDDHAQFRFILQPQPVLFRALALPLRRRVLGKQQIALPTRKVLRVPQALELCDHVVVEEHASQGGA